MDAPHQDLVQDLAATWLFVVGLAIGSFLNVVIARVPHDQSIVSPRSRCPKCGRQLPWYENIPVLSWVALRARCRGCKQPISIRYPVVELLTALLFLASLQQFGWTWPLLTALMLVFFLVALAFIDLDTWLLPDALTYPGIAAGILTAIPLGWPAIRDRLIGAAVAYLVFWAMEWIGERIFKKEALGAGDKNLLALIAAFLGYQPLLGVIFLASLQGAIVGIALLLVRGRAGPAPEGDAAPAPKEPGPEAPPAAPAEPPPAPDAAAAAEAEGDESEDDWVPGPTNMPFGPWLSLAALEILLLGGWIAARLPWPMSALIAGRG